MNYRLALVDYLNTFPFSEGIRLKQLETKLEILRVTPAQCAQLFEQRKVDISLCPIGALSDLPAHEVRGNYCIGADGPVGTVMLLSKIPLDQIKEIRLDDHSRTSNILLQILAKRLWKRDWTYYYNPDEEHPVSCLMIGDKVFKHQHIYPYQCDLADAWKTLTGLPMVFAVWITRPGVPDNLMDELDNAFSAGLSSVRSGDVELEEWQREYLLHNISYQLDSAKRNAMQLFLQWAEALVAAPILP